MTNTERLITLARAELGTQENPKGSNNVKYNTWYYGHPVSGDAYPWCMVFVQWCFYALGQTLPYRTASCSALLGWYRANDKTTVHDNPVPGDIVIYNFGHTGIVTGSNGDSITAIEGNTGTLNRNNGGEVMEQTRKKSLVTAYITAVKEIPVMDYETWKSYMQKWLDEQASSPVPEWGRKELAQAITNGITDGSRPMAFCTRLEAALMADRAKK